MNYTGPQQPNYICRKNDFLRAVQERAHELITDGPYFLPKMILLVKDGQDFEGDDLTNDVVNMMNNSKVNIILGACTGNYAEAHPEKNEIVFNRNWIAYADSLEENTTQYKNHFALAVVKYLHKYANLLTKSILEIERRYSGSTKVMQSFPRKIGTKTVALQIEDEKEVWLDDMGCRLEEILFGACIYGDFPQEGEEEWEMAQLIGLKLEYDPEHENNLQYAKFVDHCITPAAAREFKKQLMKGDARNILFLEDSCFTPYTSHSSEGKKRKLQQRNAPRYVPTPTPSVRSTRNYDPKYIAKHGFVDQAPSNKKHKV